MIYPKFKNSQLLCTVVLLGLSFSVNSQDLNEHDVLNQKDRDFHSSREVNESTFESNKTLDTLQAEVPGERKNNFRRNTRLSDRLRFAHELFIFISRVSDSKILEIPAKLIDRFSKTVITIGRSVEERIPRISVLNNQFLRI